MSRGSKLDSNLGEINASKKVFNTAGIVSTYPKNLQNIGATYNASSDTRIKKTNGYGGNFGMRSGSNRGMMSDPVSSYTNRPKSIVQSLLTPKNVYSLFDQSDKNSNTSSSQSLRGLMNSTTSTNNTIHSAMNYDNGSKNLIGSKINKNSINRFKIENDGRYENPRPDRKVSTYNETFGKDIIINQTEKQSLNDMLQHTIIQRRDFVNEIENRLRGSKADKATPTFKPITKEDIKTFNFERELERLKKTLVDIKDQECRFIKLLSRQSPSRVKRTENGLSRSEVISPAKTIEMMYKHVDVDKLNTDLPIDDPVISKSMLYNENDCMVNYDIPTPPEEIEFTQDIGVRQEVEITHQQPYGNGYTKRHQEIHTPITENKFGKKRKSSLKKKTANEGSEYNSGSSYSMKSR